MAKSDEKSESETRMNASGKSLEYEGVRWIRKDLYDRANEAILMEQRIVREMKEYIEDLQLTMDEAGIGWQVME